MASIILTACGSDSNGSSGKTDAEADKNRDQEQNEAEEKKFYQVGDTAHIESIGYGFDYEVTVNDYEITNTSDTYEIRDYVLDFDEDRDSDEIFFVITNVTITNTSDENFTPSRHVSINLSDQGREAGEIPAFEEGFPEAEENLAPGESITGDFISVVESWEDGLADSFWLKFETMTDNETIWDLPSTVE